MHKVSFGQNCRLGLFLVSFFDNSLMKSRVWKGRLIEVWYSELTLEEFVMTLLSRRQRCFSIFLHSSFDVGKQQVFSISPFSTARPRRSTFLQTLVESYFRCVFLFWTQSVNVQVNIVEQEPNSCCFLSFCWNIILVTPLCFRFCSHQNKQTLHWYRT